MTVTTANRSAIPDALSASRIVLALPFAWAMVYGATDLALVCISLAAVSDFVDGRVARALGAASERGRWVDHVADIVFLLVGYASACVIGRVAWYVPFAIGAAFSFYVADSLRQTSGSTLVGSRLGHLSGVLNYLILWGLVINASSLPFGIPTPVIDLAVAAIPIYSAASILSRTWR